VNDTMEMVTRTRTALRVNSVEDLRKYISIKIWKAD